MSNVNEPKVTVAARVEPELAAAVARLAEAGDRSFSREVRRALREHVKDFSAAAMTPTPAPAGHAVSVGAGVESPPHGEAA